MAVELQCLFSIGSVLHPSEGGPRCRPNMLAAITGHGDVSAIVILVRSDHWMRCFRIRRGSIREILRLVRACTLFCPFWGAQSFRKRSPVFFGARRPRSEIKIGEHTCLFFLVRANAVLRGDTKGVCTTGTGRLGGCYRAHRCSIECYVRRRYRQPDALSCGRDFVSRARGPHNFIRQ